MMKAKTQEFDICIVGSGAGAGPVAYELSKAGFNVAVLEKGGWYKEQDFFKDENLTRRGIFQSQRDEEFHVLEQPRKYTLNLTRCLLKAT